ncbi:MAG: hypothetical protein ABIL58_12835, partial [Pseudomonadota bacterium]
MLDNSGMNILMTEILNPFEPENRRTRYEEFCPGKTVARYIRDMVPLISNDYDIIVGVNGKIVEPEERAVMLVPAGANITFVVVPAGSGGKKGGQKNPVAMIAMIVVIAVATYLTAGAAAPYGAAALGGGTATFASTMASMAIYMGVVVGGSLLVNALFPMATPDALAMQDPGAYSPTY